MLYFLYVFNTKFALFAKLAKPVMTRHLNPNDLHGCKKIF